MRVLLGFLLAGLLTTGIFAQQFSFEIEGIVTDENGSSVSNASVELKGKFFRRNVQADGEGKFRISRVPSGVYVLTASLETANVFRISQPKEISIGQQSVGSVNLQIGAETSIRETVNVDIASGTSQPIAEVSKTVNVIDAQEIKDRNEFSLTDALRTIPGFRVQQLGGFGKTTTIKTRGLRNQDTAVLIDGVRFRDASSITGDASAFLSDFVFSDTGRIEILRGSGSSLYGTNAIGGVLDLRTNKPRNGFHGGLLSEGGNLGLKRILGNVSNGSDKIGFTLGISRTVYSEGIDGEDDANNTTANGRIDYRPNGTTNISGRIYFSDAFVRLNTSPDTIGTLPANSTIINANPITLAQLNSYAGGGTITNPGSANFIPDVNDPDNFQRSKFFNGQVVLTQLITSRLTFQAYYSGLRSTRRNENGILGVGFQSPSESVFEGTIQTANGHFNWTPASNNLVTFGYEYEFENYGNEGFTPDGSGDFSARASQASNTFYAQDLIGFFDHKLQFAGGFRAQFFNLKKPAFSAGNAPYSDLTLDDPPNAYTFDGSVSYFFDRTKTKLRAHTGNGYRVPSLYERFGTFYSSFSSAFIALGDPGLKPERSIAFDGGIDQTFFNNRAKFSATYFYTKLIDAIGYGNVVANIGSTSRPFGGYLNTKGGNSRGAEFSTEVKPFRATNIFASYTFTNSDQRAPQVSGSGILETLGVPKHQFSFIATQSFKNVTLNFDFLATGSYLAPVFSNTTFGSYVYRFKGNRRGDLTGSYIIPLKREDLRLRVFGTFGNVFGDDYYENGFRTEGRTARGGLGISF